MEKVGLRKAADVTATNNDNVSVRFVDNQVSKDFCRVLEGVRLEEVVVATGTHVMCIYIYIYIDTSA